MSRTTNIPVASILKAVQGCSKDDKPYVIRRLSDNKYLRRPGEKRYYTDDLEKAWQFTSSEMAQQNLRKKTEYALPIP